MAKFTKESIEKRAEALKMAFSETPDGMPGATYVIEHAQHQNGLTLTEKKGFKTLADADAWLTEREKERQATSAS